MLFVCQNVDCRVRKADEVMTKLQEALEGNNFIEVRPYMCFGACHEGPNLIVYPDKVWFAPVKPEDVPDVIAYLEGGAIPTNMNTINPSLKEMIFQLLDAGLY